MPRAKPDSALDALEAKGLRSSLKSGAIEVQHADDAYRSVGVTARPKRVEDQMIVLAERLEKQGFASEEVAERMAQVFPATLISNETYLRHWEGLSPVSSQPESRPRKLVEAAAIQRLEHVAWMRSWLETHGGPGRKAARLPVASLFSMAIEGGSPEVLKAAESFREANAIRGWAYDYPSLNGRSAVYETLHSTLGRSEPAAIAHVQIALMRQLAEVVDTPSKSRLTFGGKPRVGEILIVDGTQQQANVRQVKGVNSAHERSLNGRHEDARFVVYTKDGREVKRNRGYNIVMLVDEASTLPILALPFEATVNERDAVETLLGILFNLWPECPARFIVGDSLYDGAKDFARRLELKWKLHPIFPFHGIRGNLGLPGLETVNGVPRCPHGFMTHEPEGFFDGKSASAKHWERGTDLPLDYRPRIVCKCPSGICKTVYRNLRDDPWWIRYIPMAGESRLRMFGSAALARRNSVECIHAIMQMGGYWGAGPLRPKWAATPEEVRWAYTLPLMMLVAKRLVHETGIYEETLGHAERMGLLTNPSVDLPAPGPDPISLAAYRELLPVDPRPPASIELSEWN